jgi:putative CocE/NonD family hydrolase
MRETQEVELHWGVKIPLRDGVRLNATVYSPIGQRDPAPSALTITPYIADSVHERGIYFASYGTPFVVVDARGRGNSEGTFRPFIQEMHDGYDVVEWLASQPYCNGKVGMCGGSYNGYNQWVTAKGQPPHLATIIPAAAPYLGVDCPMRSNIFFPYFTQWLMYVAGTTGQGKLFADRAFWSGLYGRWHRSGRSFKDFVRSFGPPAAHLEEWLAHPAPDEYWDARNPTSREYQGIQIPVLTITGIYDDDQPGALTHYAEHVRNATAAARKRHYLVIGPWDHAGTYVPTRKVGGLECGPASLLDLPGLYRQWYGWTLQDGPKPTFLQGQVAYYVMGAERWRYADSLDEIASSHIPFFLDSNGQANDVFRSGFLSPNMGRGVPDSYRYDPRDADGPEIEAEERTTGGSVLDQGVILALSGKALIYHSEPFQADTEVSGFFKLSAWISIDVPDTDFYVSVYEITTQSESIRLSTDGMRARYREGPRTTELIRTCDPLRYEFERFTFVSRVVKRGHRLRLVIAPMGRLLETTFAEKNYNAGGVVAEESAADGRAVTVMLHHDAEHPSTLYVPLGRPESPGEPTAPMSCFIVTHT